MTFLRPASCPSSSASDQWKDKVMAAARRQTRSSVATNVPLLECATLQSDCAGTWQTVYCPDTSQKSLVLCDHCSLGLRRLTARQ